MTFFLFKSDKHRDWSLHIIHKCFIVKFIWNFFVQVFQFIPFFSSDYGSSFCHQINQFFIFICEWNLSNSLSLCFSCSAFSEFLFVCFTFFTIITSLIINSVVDDHFDMILHETFELSIFTHWIWFVTVSILPFFISFISNIKLTRVISSGNSFDIPVDEAQLLAVVDVINVKSTEEENKKHKG